jgi:hypothetical protein
MKFRRAMPLIAAFIAGIVVAMLAPKLIYAVFDRTIFPEQQAEVQRLTSPDGVADAVLESINCGSPCGLTYAVSVVRRGDPVPKDRTKWIFLAEDMVSPSLRWKEAHLLDISYDRAFIHEFRNVTYFLARTGDVESWQYGVEVHLSPSSARFSYLKDTNRVEIVP